MNNKQAIKILKEEKSWESDDRKIDAFNMAIEALDKLDKIEKALTLMVEKGNSQEYRNEGYRTMLLELETLGDIHKIVKSLN